MEILITIAASAVVSAVVTFLFIRANPKKFARADQLVDEVKTKIQ